MVSRILRSIVIGLLSLVGVAAAQRPAGVIGSYSPPRAWPQEPLRFDLLHQSMALRFEASQGRVVGTVTTRVRVTLAPTDTIRLDAENLTIDHATDAHSRPLRFSADTSHVTVRLGHRAAVGDTVEFSLYYRGTPERGLYFVPRRHVIWSQGEATETRAWIPTYDAPNDKTTWEFRVTADSGDVVLSNGRLESVTPVEGGKQQVWHWVQDKPASTYLYSVVVGPFTVLRDQWRGIPVDYYTYGDTTLAAWRSFGETPSMIELYSELLGVPFPWDKYDQSIIPDFTYGGMENVSATTQTDLALHGVGDEPQNAGRGLAAHELAHQWFGDLTTTADWADVWLNEGLTTYMASVQDERTRGWDAAEQEWWEQQRAAMQADARQPRPLVWGQYQGTDPITLFFSGHVYPKGAQVAHQLRRLLGDSLFWAGMHRFLVDNAYRPVTTADYATAMERTCNCDLDWFFDQWAYGIGYPKVRFARQWDSAGKVLHVTVEQTQAVDTLHPLFRFPVTLRVITRDSVVRHEIVVSRARETFDVPLPATPVSFRFDEGGWLLGSVTGDLTSAELAQLARHDLDIRARHWALDQLATAQDSLALATRRFVVLNDHSGWLRSTALRQMAGDSAPVSVTVVRSALRDPDSDVRAAALSTLRGLDSAAAVTAAAAMYPSDPNNSVRQAALDVLADSRGKAALPLLLDAATAGPLSLRFTAARYLSRLGGPQAEDALERLTAPEEDRNLRMTGLDALAATGDTSRVLAVAFRALGDPDPLFAVFAVRIIGRVGGPAGRARLRDAERRETRVTVRAAMATILEPH